VACSVHPRFAHTAEFVRRRRTEESLTVADVLGGTSGQAAAAGGVAGQLQLCGEETELTQREDPVGPGRPPKVAVAVARVETSTLGRSGNFKVQELERALGDVTDVDECWERLDSDATCLGPPSEDSVTHFCSSKRSICDAFIMFSFDQSGAGLRFWAHRNCCDSSGRRLSIHCDTAARAA